MLDLCDTMACDGTVIYLNEGSDLFEKSEIKGVFAKTSFTDFLKHQPFGVNVKNAIMDITLNFDEGITIHENVPKKMRIYMKTLSDVSSG